MNKSRFSGIKSISKIVIVSITFLLVPVSASANVDVTGLELDFSNSGANVGQDATETETFGYLDVVPGSIPQVNAILTVSDFENITTLDFVDENEHSKNKPIDFQMYNIDSPDAYASLKVEFFDGSSGDGFSDSILLENLSITVKDIDIYQSIEVDSPTAYELSRNPSTALTVTSDLINNTLTFTETNGDSFDDKDQEAWAVLNYDSVSEFNLRGFVKWGGSFTIEFKTTEYSNSETEFPIVANGYRADNLGSVYFAPGSSKLSKAAQDQIKAMVTANPSAIYKVTGYVQKSATKVNDARISLARARAVETYLKSLGAGVNFTVVIETGLVPNKDGNTPKARKATLFAMTPVVL